MGDADLAGNLATALAELAGAAHTIRGQWWVIGSAAVALHGGRTCVADVDVLCEDPADARALIAMLGGAVLTGGTDLFRSAVFGRCEGALPIEVMAGLTVRREPVRLATREWRRHNGVMVPTPSRQELIALLKSFGREKDLTRAALLSD